MLPIIKIQIRENRGSASLKSKHTKASQAESLTDVAVEIERTILSVAPGITRVVKYDAPTFQGQGDIMTIGVWTKFVAVGFWNGAKLSARHPMLEGAGAVSRVAKLRSLKEAKSKEFKALIRDAVKLDAISPVHPKKKQIK